MAAAVTAAVLAAPAHHARPAPAVPPLFSRIAAVTPPRTPGHWQYVSSVVFRPDGRTLATGMTTGTGGVADGSRSPGETFLWNVATGNRTFALAGVGDGGEAFSADGKRAGRGQRLPARQPLLLGSGHRQTGRDLGNVHEPITAVAFSPDGKVLTAEDTTGVVYLWNLVTGQLTNDIGRSADPYSYGLAISPDSQHPRHPPEQRGQGRGLPVEPGRQPDLRHPYRPRRSPVLSVAFSPDGKMIAISGSNGKTSLWDTATRKFLATTFTDPGSSGVTAAAFSPDGEMLATGDYNGKTYLWNLRTRTLAAVLADPGGTLAPAFVGKDRNAVISIAFSPDGKTLATSGTNGSAYLWRIR